MTRAIKNASSSLIAVGAVLAASAAQAQSAPPHEAAVSGGLTEIVVTAQKRAENLQKVPIAITAVTSDALTASGSYNVLDLEKVAPGLQVYQTGSAVLPFLRGVGSNQSTNGFESPIAVYVDGIYKANKSGNNFDLANIERIEVLKGPQGTLFGRNATGGAINIITKDPGDRLELDVEGGYGRFNEKRAKLYAAGPITDTLSGSVSYTGRWDRGYIYNTYLDIHANPARNQVVMGKLVWKPDEDLTIKLSGSYFDHDDATFLSPHNVAGTIAKGSDPTGFNNDPALPSTTVPGVLVPIGAPVPVTNYDNYVSRNDHKARVHTSGYNITLNVNYDLGAVRLVSLTGYMKDQSFSLSNSDISESILALSGSGQPAKEISQEFQIQSNDDGPLKWMGGLYYMYFREGFAAPGNNFISGSNVPIPIRPSDLLPEFGGSGAGRVTAFSSNVFTDAYAAFAQASYDITPELQFTAGIRYNTESKRVSGSLYNYIAVPGTTNENQDLYETALGGDGLVFDTANFIDLNAKKKFSKLTWRLALDYKVTPDAMVYASFNRGFKSGTFNPSVFTGPQAGVPVNPEVLDAYEVGFKTELFDRRVRLNGAAFYYDYSNLQVGLITSAGVTTVQNAASARLYGLDLDLTVAATDHLTLRGAINLLDTKYKNYGNAQIFLPRTTATATCPTGAAVQITPAQAQAIAGQPKMAGACSYSFDASGQDLIFAPKFTANVGVDYNIPLGEARVMLSGSFYYNDGYDIVPGGFFGHINSYESASLSATYYAPDDRYYIGLWGDNLTNDHHPIYISPQSAGFQEVSARPVSYGIRIGFKLGG